jgi:long-chain acyl-CoA synthetase
MGEMLGGLKGMLVNFVVRSVKKMVPPYSLPNAALQGCAVARRRHEADAGSAVANDPAFLQYTGGTTGVSKGATLTHTNIVANLLQTEAWSARRWAVNEQSPSCARCRCTISSR